MNDRAAQVAARLRRLEQIRGKRAPIYGADPRLRPWACLPDTDIREAYEMAITDLEERGSSAVLTVGRLVPYLEEVGKTPAALNRSKSRQTFGDFCVFQQLVMQVE